MIHEYAVPEPSQVNPARLQSLADDVSSLLSSVDIGERQRGYELFDSVVKQCLYQSCLNYRGLLGSYSDPVTSIMMRVVESWAAGTRATPIADRAARLRERLLDEVGEESFPASDPPAGNIRHLGAPCCGQLEAGEGTG